MLLIHIYKNEGVRMKIKESDLINDIDIINENCNECNGYIIKDTSHYVCSQCGIVYTQIYKNNHFSYKNNSLMNDFGYVKLPFYKLQSDCSVNKRLTKLNIVDNRLAIEFYRYFRYYHLDLTEIMFIETIYLKTIKKFNIICYKNHILIVILYFYLKDKININIIDYVKYIDKNNISVNYIYTKFYKYHLYNYFKPFIDKKHIIKKQSILENQLLIIKKYIKDTTIFDKIRHLARQLVKIESFYNSSQFFTIAIIYFSVRIICIREQYNHKLTRYFLCKLFTIKLYSFNSYIDNNKKLKSITNTLIKEGINDNTVIKI